MRISQLIARVEDKAIEHAPKAKAATQARVARSASWLSDKLAALAVKAAPKAEVQG